MLLLYIYWPGLDIYSLNKKAIIVCLVSCWQCSVTRPHPELAEMTSGQSEAGLTGPRPMRGLHGRCHGNVRICGKLVASAGNSISHIPALLGGAPLATVGQFDNRIISRFVVPVGL